MSIPVAGRPGFDFAENDREIARLNLITKILDKVSGLGLDEVEVVHEVVVGLVRGREVYGQLDAVYDHRAWQDEADQEGRDLSVYLASDVIRRRRRKEHR